MKLGKFLSNASPHFKKHAHFLFILKETDQNISMQIYFEIHIYIYSLSRTNQHECESGLINKQHIALSVKYPGKSNVVYCFKGAITLEV